MLRRLASAIILLLVASVRALDAGGQVLQIPNFEGNDNGICWSRSSGYLNATDDHQLFYWYHEAVEAPEEKALVLWLNGGPGASNDPKECLLSINLYACMRWTLQSAQCAGWLAREGY